MKPTRFAIAMMMLLALAAASRFAADAGSQGDGGMDTPTLAQTGRR